jgi:hypothetical protein
VNHLGSQSITQGHHLRAGFVRPSH